MSLSGHRSLFIVALLTFDFDVEVLRIVTVATWRRLTSSAVILLTVMERLFSFFGHSLFSPRALGSQQ